MTARAYRPGDPEFRFVEFRVAGDAVEGTAIRYGDVATIGEFSERFEPGSISFSDVIANIMHDRSKPVARTGSGLTLSDGPDALRARIEAPDTVYGREMRELLSAGLLRGLSVEFRAIEDHWEGSTRIVRRAELTGIGVVDRPAYPDSAIAARMLAGRQPLVKPRRRFAQ